MTDVLIIVFLTQDGGIQNGHEHYPKWLLLILHMIQSVVGQKEMR